MLLYISVSCQVNFSHKMIAKAVDDRHAGTITLPQRDGLLFLITIHYVCYHQPIAITIITQLTCKKVPNPKVVNCGHRSYGEDTKSILNKKEWRMLNSEIYIGNHTI